LRLKILKKLKTASLNSEFTGSYKKKCILLTFDQSWKLPVIQAGTRKHSYKPERDLKQNRPPYRKARESILFLKTHMNLISAQGEDCVSEIKNGCHQNWIKYLNSALGLKVLTNLAWNLAWPRNFTKIQIVLLPLRWTLFESNDSLEHIKNHRFETVLFIFHSIITYTFYSHRCRTIQRNRR